VDAIRAIVQAARGRNDIPFCDHEFVHGPPNSR
jgi:hypothetical protein